MNTSPIKLRTTSKCCSTNRRSRRRCTCVCRIFPGSCGPSLIRSSPWQTDEPNGRDDFGNARSGTSDCTRPDPAGPQPTARPARPSRTKSLLSSASVRSPEYSRPPPVLSQLIVVISRREPSGPDRLVDADKAPWNTGGHFWEFCVCLIS